MTRGVSICLGGLFLTLLLEACGGSSPSEEREIGERERVEAVAERFAAAVEAKDAEAFCAVLAPNDKAGLTGGTSDGEKRCLTVWGLGRNPLFAAKDPDLSLEEIAKLDSGTAVAELGGGGRLAFSKEQGSWYVSLAPEGQGRSR
jgi:hypothetical protein